MYFKQISPKPINEGYSLFSAINDLANSPEIIKAGIEDMAAAKSIFNRKCKINAGIQKSLSDLLADKEEYQEDFYNYPYRVDYHEGYLNIRRRLDILYRDFYESKSIAPYRSALFSLDREEFYAMIYMLIIGDAINTSEGTQYVYPCIIDKKYIVFFALDKRGNLNTIAYACTINPKDPNSPLMAGRIGEKEFNYSKIKK